MVGRCAKKTGSVQAEVRVCVSCVFSFYSAWPRDDFIFVSFTCMWMLDFVREHEIRGYLVRLSDLFCGLLTVSVL